MMKRFAALYTSPSASFIDHIAPLASLLKIPLLVTEEEHALKIATYYPEVELHHWPDLPLRLEELCAKFDTLIECGYWADEFRRCLETLYGKKMHLIFCPHGQSDKGYLAPLLAPYAKQEKVLLYGDLMKEMLSDLKIALPKHAVVGNYRKLYYERHRARHLKWAQERIFSKLDPSCPTLLYAPTWNDLDQASTFFEGVERLIEQKSASWNLLIKAHPLLLQKEPARFYRLNLEKKGVVVDCDFPLIYPLLERSAAYLGDYSSIGYDALSFDKPLFFLTKPQLPEARLHACGEVLDPKENLFEKILQKIPQAGRFQKNREALYQKAFAKGADVRQAVEER